ncbi:DUF3159 domain-containing protein [Streptomyces sp. NBC_00859]|uniref:DUF3159 domain-containing protein n=1 Tax=Streptomyces sp. NBC_00859 TaxID=2903682 RepID=UPI00386D73FB|nr:DUF3159 domain-containing protein [Streptomyces sp. NBC_00859]
MELTTDPRSTEPPGRSARRNPGKNGWASRLSATVVTAAPTAAFLVANAVDSLDTGLIAAGATAVAAFAWRLLSRQKLRQALAGLVIVGVCATVAAVTGEARGFFLLPALIPFAVIAVCLGSILAGRPLTGLLLNRVSGGPPDWRTVPRLRRIHRNATWVCVAVNVANAALQVIYYRDDEPLVLGIVHIATGPVFATIVAVTITVARRALPARQG